MAAVSDFEHLVRAPASLLRGVDEVDSQIVDQLQTSGSTILVNGLRTCTMERTIIAAGTIGVFEGLVQRRLGGRFGFNTLDTVLRSEGHSDLADRFKYFRVAINALKHGDGASYERLLSRTDELPFRIREKDSHFLDEGDVSEIDRHVAVDSEFIARMIAIIEEISAAMKFE